MAKTAPAYIEKGGLCLLRQTSRGDNPKAYGVVGVYRVVEVQKHDPKTPIPGWNPRIGWANIVKLEEILVLPSVFNEKFCFPTNVLRHKESKFVEGLINKDIQGDSRAITEPAASNYIVAIENSYPRLAELLGDSRFLSKLVSKKALRKDQARREKQARKLTDEELKARLADVKPNRTRQSSISRVYIRNEYVAEFVRRRANGVCELCGCQAPFSSKAGVPFLEEHHVEWLSRGGKDTIDNAVALCPNCHRKMHVLKSKGDKLRLINLARKSLDE